MEMIDKVKHAIRGTEKVAIEKQTQQMAGCLRVGLDEVIACRGETSWQDRSSEMWQVLIARYSRILVMPVVMVIGAIGYFMEQKFSTPKKIPYLDASVKERREKRQMEIEIDSEYGASVDISKIKSKIVPESSLMLNSGRKDS
uniref:Miff domain-containing protein n=1 Tax=Elaeophora elaphi TaxID=1147741 RepID=A0A0R3RU11_9BILA